MKANELPKSLYDLLPAEVDALIAELRAGAPSSGRHRHVIRRAGGGLP